jgi:hypothetical protein
MADREEVAMTDSPWKCAACGVPGKISTITVAPGDTRPVLRISFSGANGRPMLPCALCRDAEALPTPRPRASVPTDGD